jgi:hypothetical protein
MGTVIQQRGPWLPNELAELVRLANKRPRPSNADIAFAVGRSQSAVGVKLSALRIVHPLYVNKARRPNRRIACITCRRPFGSQGAHNRMCGRCRLNPTENVWA